MAPLKIIIKFARLNRPWKDDMGVFKGGYRGLLMVGRGLLSAGRCLLREDRGFIK